VSQVNATTTTPDDVFYILRVVLSRLLSTGSAKAVQETLEQLREAMDGDFIGVIKKRLDEVYRMASNIGPGGRGEKGDREGRLTFLVSVSLIRSRQLRFIISVEILLNDLDVSSSHLERLTKDLLSHPTIPQHFLEVEQQSAKDNILSFSSSLLTKLRSSTKVRRTSH
jgi:hypothetical protein